MLTAVTGIKWGDEGKGRVIDLLAERADIVVRYQGGNNAGHTVVTKQGKFILNLLPSGILHPNVVCVLADGMVVDLEHLSNEKAYSTCVGAGPFVAENAMPEEWKESLRKAGGEYGAATGRPRRVGPFDAVASRYGLKCQRADKIALTKLDVLSYMQEIPIITGYLYKGKETDTFVPTENLEEYQPVISFIPGWKQDISACRRWEELPDAAKNYIKTLEKLLDHEIQFISVGAKREEYLIKGEWL